MKKFIFILVLLSVLSSWTIVYAHVPEEGYQMGPWMMWWGHGSGWWIFPLVMIVVMLIFFFLFFEEEVDGHHGVVLVSRKMRTLL
jgi:uncharacterized membrane protein